METTKIDLLSQLDNCVDILFSYIHNDELRYNSKKYALNGDTALDICNYHKLSENGYEMNGTKITIHYNETGKISFEIDRLIMVIDMVKKSFPNHSVTEQKTTFRTAPYRAKLARDIMSLRDTFAESEQAFECAKHNLEESVQSGNKKLIEVFKKNFDIEVECMRYARTIDYKKKARESEFKQSGWEKIFYNQFCKGESNTNYYALGFSPINCDNYFLLKENDMLSPDLTYEEAAIICDFYKQGLPMDDYEKLQLSNYSKSEIELKAKFGRKNGDGFRKPKSNNELYSFNKLQNILARYKFVLNVLNRIFAEEVENMVY